MLTRTAIAGLVLCVLFAGVFVALVDWDCGTAQGCEEGSWLQDRFGRWFGDGGQAGEQVTTRTIPEPPGTGPATASQTARLPAPRKVVPPAPVDSHALDEQYDILKWNLVAYRSGSIDAVQAAGGPPDGDGRLTLSKGDYIRLSGWAGHPAYGMRFRDVLFSLCGKVVGRAAVKGLRPDVAAAVHRNLEQSGWSAKLATDLLPRCEQQVLQAWGVAPIGHNIFPLNGQAAIYFVEPPGSAERRYQPRLSPLTPAENGAVELMKINVRASALRLRQCGDVSCKAVGRVSQGTHEGYVLETVGDWTLFQIGSAVGWASNRYLSVQ